MSESEKNENELQQEEFQPTDNSDLTANEEMPVSEISTQEDEELNNELEEIKDKFQELLHDAAQTYLAGGDIQDYEEEQPETDDEPLNDDELCECCGEKRRDVSLGEDYPYCSECRELMQHYPFSFKGILTLIIVLILSCVSIFNVFSSNYDLIDSALTADNNYNSGKIYSALEGYGSLLQNYTSSSSDILGAPAVPKKVAARYARAYASLVNYSYANSVVEQFFTQSDLKNPAYRSLSEYSSKYEFYSKIMETINNALQAEEPKASDIHTLLDQLREDDDSDSFLIDYYKYIVTQYLGDTNENQYEMLVELKENYPDKWPVKYELCAICSKLGKVQEAQECLGEVIKHNSEDGAIYAYLADAYRFSQTPDADKMLEAVEKGFEADGDSGYSTTDLNRVKALAYLLKGDYDSAYDAASAAYQTAYQSLYYGYTVNNIQQILYTYQLCAHLKDDKDAYDSVTEIFDYIGIEGSSDLNDYINGEKTLEEILTDGEGDLA